MSLAAKSTPIRVVVVLGIQAPFWWLKDLATLFWPELDAGGTLDLLVSIGCVIAAIVTALKVMDRVVEPMLIPEVRDES